jgi:hypothetical protein
MNKTEVFVKAPVKLACRTFTLYNLQGFYNAPIGRLYCAYIIEKKIRSEK